MPDPPLIRHPTVTPVRQPRRSGVDYAPDFELRLGGPIGEERWELEDPLAGPLDRVRAAAVISAHPELKPAGRDGWRAKGDRLRVTVEADRIVLRFRLGPAERESLAQELDAVFDLGFELAETLRLELYDGLLGQLLTRHRYETSFGRLLDLYHRRMRVLAALTDARGWKAFASRPLALPRRMPAFESLADLLPPATWSPVGPRALGALELSGRAVLEAIAALEDLAPFLAVLPVGYGKDDDAAVIRIERLIHPLPEVALVEATGLGLARIGQVVVGPPLEVDLFQVEQP